MLLCSKTVLFGEPTELLLCKDADADDDNDNNNNNL